MKRFAALVTFLCLCLPVFSGALESLVKTDGRTSFKPIVSFKGRANAAAFGVMWEGWQEDSAWATIRADYSREEENGSQFLRVVVSSKTFGQCQFMHAIPALPAGTLLSLKFTARISPGMALNVGIRMNGEPYSYYWSADAFTGGKDWKEYSYIFELKEAASDAGIFLCLPGLGFVEIKELALERAERKDIVAMAMKKYSAPAAKNLLPSSRFPFGFVDGRGLSTAKGVSVTPESGIAGPGGNPAIKLVSEEGGSVTVAGFAVGLPYSRYTASLYASGKGKIDVSVMSGDRQVASTSWQGSGTSWQRIALTFESGLDTAGYTLALGVKGELNAEGFQIEAGGKPTAYKPQAACEVALGRMVTGGEVRSVKYSVAGKRPEGAVLKIKSSDVYGTGERTAVIPLPAGEKVSGESGFGVPDDNAAGTFNIEAWVEGKDGRRASATAKIVVRKLTSWPQKMRGVTGNLNLKEKDIEDLSKWGVNIVRLMIGYGRLVRKEPPYEVAEHDLKNIDNFLTWCEKRNIRVLIDLHEIPGKRDVCDVKDRDPRIWSDYFYHDLLINVWKILAARYKDRGAVVAGYDILNEPNPDSFIKDTPSDWYVLARRVVAAIREIDKNTPVIIEPIGWGGVTKYDTMVPVVDPKVIYSFHIYLPHELTHQGVAVVGQGNTKDVSYPGKINGMEWNRKQLEHEMRYVLDFAKKYDAEMIAGEFSSIRYAPGDSTVNYLRDLVNIYEENGFNWTYHAFREFSGWSLEHSGDKANEGLEPGNPRLRLMKGFFGLNK